MQSRPGYSGALMENQRVTLLGVERVACKGVERVACKGVERVACKGVERVACIGDLCNKDLTLFARGICIKTKDELTTWSFHCREKRLKTWMRGG